MLQGDRSYLKASLTRGILDMQNRLIKLYVVNLQAIGTQSAFIAGFSFSGVGPIIMPRTGTTWFGLNFLYDIFIHSSMCLAVFASSHATIVTMYAPATALKGAEFETVSYVSKMILEQKYFVLYLCVLALTSLFLASIMNYWAKLPWPVAFSIMIVNLTGFVILLFEGLRVYNIFHPNQEIYLSDAIRKYILNKQTTPIPSDPEEELESVQEEKEMARGEDESEVETNVTGKSRETGYTKLTLDLHSDRAKINFDKMGKSELRKYQQMTQVRARGMIWWKSPISSGGNGTFYCRYAVVEKGLLNFFRNEEAFTSNERPLNDSPYQISSYNLETDYSRFPKGITSGVKSIRKRVIGQGEFSVLQILSSEYDLKTAVKKYRFVLISQMSSELIHLEPIELMASDEDQYALWISAFTQIISAHRYLESLKTIEEDTLSGNSSLGIVVKAANARI